MGQLGVGCVDGCVWVVGVAVVVKEDLVGLVEDAVLRVLVVAGGRGERGGERRRGD